MSKIKEFNESLTWFNAYEWLPKPWENVFVLYNTTNLESVPSISWIASNGEWRYGPPTIWANIPEDLPPIGYYGVEKL